MQKKRLVSFIDVLGFSELVARIDFGEKFDQYVELIKGTIKEVSNDIDYVVFSDSIVIVAPTDSEDDLFNLIRVTGALSFKFLVELDLPVKGCITSGNVTYSSIKKDTVIAGSPIVEAYRYEQQMDWVGAIISPNTARKFPAINQKLAIDSDVKHVSGERLKQLVANVVWNISLQRYSSIPLKSPSTDDAFLEGFCIVPHKLSSIDASHILEDLKEYHCALDEQALYAPDPRAQRKYKNTKRFISDIYSRWNKVGRSTEYKNAAWVTHEEMRGDILSRTQQPPPRK